MRNGAACRDVPCDTIPRRMKIICILAIAGAAFAQNLALAPKPKELPKYAAPHKPHTRIADLKKSHANEANWRETVVDDDHLNAAYVYSAPGAKVARRFHPDTREWWIVMDGQ